MAHLGIQPGPTVGQLLKLAHELQQQNETLSVDEILNKLESHWRSTYGITTHTEYTSFRRIFNSFKQIVKKVARIG